MSCNLCDPRARTSFLFGVAFTCVATASLFLFPTHPHLSWPRHRQPPASFSLSNRTSPSSRPPGSATRPHTPLRHTARPSRPPWVHTPPRHTARPSRSPWVTHPAAIACFRAIPGQPYGLFASLFFSLFPIHARTPAHTHTPARMARSLSLSPCLLCICGVWVCAF